LSSNRWIAVDRCDFISFIRRDDYLGIGKEIDRSKKRSVIK